MRVSRVLSLDTSTKVSGYAVYDNNNLIYYSSINTSDIKDTDDRMRSMLLQIFSIIERESPETVVVEEMVVPRNPQTQRLLTMILGAIYGECLHKSIHYCSLRPTQWRSDVKEKNEKLPRRREELKQWSINKVKSDFGIDDVDDNISDAILIGKAYLNKN